MCDKNSYSWGNVFAIIGYFLILNLYFSKIGPLYYIHFFNQQKYKIFYHSPESFLKFNSENVHMFFFYKKINESKGLTDLLLFILSLGYNSKVYSIASSILYFFLMDKK